MTQNPTQNPKPVYSVRGNNIFISYANADLRFVKQLDTAIRDLGRDPWIDLDDIPVEIDAESEAAWEFIQEGIKNIEVFVFVLSLNSIESEKSRKELNLAIEQKKRLIPVLYQSSSQYDLTEEQIPEVFKDPKLPWIIFDPEASAVNSAILSDPNYPTNSIDEVAKRIVHIHIYERLLAKANIWDRNGRSRGLLLYGADLESLKDWRNENPNRKPQFLPLQQQYIDESIAAKEQNFIPELPGIFVSYSRRDKDFVKALYEKLRAEGLQLWVDWENIPIAADWRMEIKQGIEAAHTFLFIVSADSVKSANCYEEVEQAAAKKTRMISVLWRDDYDRELFRDKQKSALQVLRRYNWLDCNCKNWATVNEAIENTLPKLIETINDDLDYAKDLARLQAYASEWDRNQRKIEFLFGGERLTIAEQLLKKGKEIEAQWYRDGRTEELPPTPLPTPLLEEFVHASTQAAAEQKKQEKSRQRRFRILTSAIFIFLVLAALASYGQLRAVSQGIKALVSSLEGVQELDALVNGLRAGQELQGLPGRIVALQDSDLRVRVVTALQQQIYNLRELNRLVGHEEQVFNASFSPDGELLASASADGSVNLWDRHGKLIDTLRVDFGERGMPGMQTQSIVNAVFNPGIYNNQYTLALAGDGGMVYLWQITQVGQGQWQVPDQPIQSLPATKATNGSLEQSRVLSLSFSPGGQVLAAGSIDGRVTLWRQQPDGSFNPNPIQTIDRPTGILSLNFSPLTATGGKFAFTDSTGIITILSSSDLFQTVQQTSRKHGEGLVLHLEFSPDGTMLASAGTNKLIKLWNLQSNATSNETAITLEGHEDRIYRVAFSPDGNLLASASRDGSVRLWQTNGRNWENGSSSRVLRGHQDWVYRVEFSPNGHILASAGADDTVKFWTIDGTLIDTLEGHQDEVLDIEFSFDGRTLVSASKDKTIRLWKVESPVRILSHNNRVYDVSFTSDGRIVATSGQDTIRLWRTEDGTSVLKQPIEQKGTISSISLAPQGDMASDAGQLLAAAGESEIKLWKIERREDGYQAQPAGALTGGHQGLVRGVSFSPSGALLASAGADGVVNLWQIQAVASDRPGEVSYAWQLLQLLDLKHEGGAYSVGFSPDGRWLASTGADGRVNVWRLTRQDDRYEVKLQKSLQAHEGLVYDVSFSPNNKMLATAGADGTVKLWQLGNLQESPQTLIGHTDEVLSVGFSPTQNILASAGRDDTIRLWTTDGNLSTTLKRHRREVPSVMFSPDGETLASASYDTRALLWKISQAGLAQLSKEGCRLAQDYLQTYEGNRPQTSIANTETYADISRYCDRFPIEQNTLTSNRLVLKEPIN